MRLASQHHAVFTALAHGGDVMVEQRRRHAAPLIIGMHRQAKHKRICAVGLMMVGIGVKFIRQMRRICRTAVDKTHHAPILLHHKKLFGEHRQSRGNLRQAGGFGGRKAQGFNFRHRGGFIGARGADDEIIHVDSFFQAALNRSNPTHQHGFCLCERRAKIDLKQPFRQFFGIIRPA